MSRLPVVILVIASTCGGAHVVALDRAPVVPDFMLELVNADKPLADVIRSVSPFKIATMDGQSSALRKEIESLSFRIPDTASEEILKEAQLKIYASIHNRKRTYYGIERLLQVTLRSPDEKSVNVEASPTTLMQIYLKRNTWLSVNMSQSFRAWRQLGRTELHVHLHVLNPYTNVGATGDLEFNLDKEQRLEPFLLLLYDLETRPSAPEPPVTHNVSKRSIPIMDFKEADDYEEETNNIWDDDIGVRSAAALHTTTTTTTPEPKIQPASKTNKNLCRRKPMYVDFAEIQYDSWVLAPTGYEAFQCAGRCVYPISDHLTPTKHSVVQTLVHSLSSKRAQKACCVPTKLKPISMLYLDDDGVLTYRFSYEDMVVAECGCR